MMCFACPSLKRWPGIFFSLFSHHKPKPMKKRILFLMIVLLSAAVFTNSCTELDGTIPNFTSDKMIIKVSPNGMNDTENLRAAFKKAAACEEYCVVNLKAGEYFLSPIVVHNFRGELKGAYGGQTIVTSLVEGDFMGWGHYAATPSTNACLFSFVGGDPSVTNINFNCTDDGIIKGTVDKDNSWID